MVIKRFQWYLGWNFGESRWYYRMDGISFWLPQLVAPKGLWHLGISLCWTCFWCARLFQIQSSRCQRVIPEGQCHFGGSIFGVVDRTCATLVPWITRARSSGFWVWCVLVSWNINSCCWRSKILCWRRLRRAGVLYWEIKLLETGEVSGIIRVSQEITGCQNQTGSLEHLTDRCFVIFVPGPGQRASEQWNPKPSEGGSYCGDLILLQEGWNLDFSIWLLSTFWQSPGGCPTTLAQCVERAPGQIRSSRGSRCYG